MVFHKNPCNFEIFQTVMKYFLKHYIIIYCVFEIRTSIPYLIIISTVPGVQIVSSLSERRLEQANLITKEKLPILKRSQNKPPQTINDLQFISHVITYNIACF